MPYAATLAVMIYVYFVEEISSGRYTYKNSNISKGEAPFFAFYLMFNLGASCFLWQMHSATSMHVPLPVLCSLGKQSRIFAPSNLQGWSYLLGVVISHNDRTIRETVDFLWLHTYNKLAYDMFCILIVSQDIHKIRIRRCLLMGCICTF